MPLLVRYPAAVKAGSTSEAICMNVDFAPTFLDFAGVKMAKDLFIRRGSGYSPAEITRELGLPLFVKLCLIFVFEEIA